jgi:hypothetical protein
LYLQLIFFAGQLNLNPVFTKGYHFYGRIDIA